MKNLLVREAKYVVKKLKWSTFTHSTINGKDMVLADVHLGKDDTMSVYAPREIVEKLTGKKITR